MDINKIKDLIKAIVRDRIFKADKPYMDEQRNYITSSQKKRFINLLNNKYPYLSVSLLEIGSRGGVSDNWTPLLKLKNLSLFGVDPDEEEAKALMKQKEIPYMKVYTDVIYKEDCEVPLYITKDLGFTSIYEPNLELLKYYPGTKGLDIQKKIFIKAKALDNVITEDNKIDFINIDVQGAEYDVILGGQRVFKNIIGATLETHLFEYYKGEKTFADVYNLLKKDFSVINLSLRSIGGEISEIGDSVFIRKAIQIKSKDEIIKRILYAVLFNRKEHVEFLLRNNPTLLSEEEKKEIGNIFKIDLTKQYRETELPIDTYSATNKYLDGGGYESKNSITNNSYA